MKRYTIKASYTTNDIGARICPEEDTNGEWVKYEDVVMLDAGYFAKRKQCEYLYKENKRLKSESPQPQWVKLDLKDHTTWPEDGRKVWLAGEKIMFEQEEIAYLCEGQMFYSNCDIAIDISFLEGVYWQYVVLPQTPPPSQSPKQ